MVSYLTILKVSDWAAQIALCLEMPLIYSLDAKEGQKEGNQLGSTNGFILGNSEKPP